MTPLIVNPSLMELEVASTRGKAERAEPSDMQDPWPSPMFGKSLSLLGSASLFAKRRGLLPLFLCLLEKQIKGKHAFTRNA